MNCGNEQGDRRTGFADESAFVICCFGHCGRGWGRFSTSKHGGDMRF